MIDFISYKYSKNVGKQIGAYVSALKLKLSQQEPITY